MISTPVRFLLFVLALVAGAVALQANYALGGHDQMALTVLLVYSTVTAVIASIPRKVKYKTLRPVYIGAREEVTETDIEINS